MEQGVATLQQMLDRLGRPSELISPLLAYAERVRVDADRLGLVSKAGVEELLDRHIGESLAFAQVETPAAGALWVDVGSGAGLPGVPLAICYPQARFTLIEPQQRRAGFLELTVEDLGLSDVEVRAIRAQDVDLQADVVVTRAFSSREAAGASEATFSLLKGLVRPGGLVVIQVGQGVRAPEGTSLVRTVLGDDETGAEFLIMRVS